MFCGNLLQYSCLKNPIQRGIWWAMVLGVTKSNTDPMFLGFPGGASDKEPSANSGDINYAGSILGWRRSPGEGNGNSLQCSCLGNPMDRRAWVAFSPWNLKRVRHNLATEQQTPCSSQRKLIHNPLNMLFFHLSRMLLLPGMSLTFSLLDNSSSHSTPNSKTSSCMTFLSISPSRVIYSKFCFTFFMIYLFNSLFLFKFNGLLMNLSHSFLSSLAHKHSACSIIGARQVLAEWIKTPFSSNILWNFL